MANERGLEGGCRDYNYYSHFPAHLRVERFQSVYCHPDPDCGHISLSDFSCIYSVVIRPSLSGGGH